MAKQGNLDNIQNGSTTGLFSGNIKEGNSNIPFTDQAFVDNNNNPITDIKELGFDSLIQFNEVGGNATECKARVQVVVIGTLSRPNTSSQIKNLVNAIEKETGTNMGVIIRKG